ncbi:MAG: acyl-CoA dehydrogenase family protein [Myxococcota bacterium]
MTADRLLREVERIRPVLEDGGRQAEAERALPDAAYDAMLDAGLFRMLVPRAFGGLELHPVEAYRVVEAVARIDSAAAWNLNQSSGVAALAAWLPKDGGQELYARGPDVICAGGFFPPGPSVPIEGGWRLTARTSFVSGCNRAHWFGVPMLEVAEDASRFDPKREDPPPIVGFVPRDEVDLLDTWRTSGMRGTGSADVSVDDVFVPERRVAHIDPNRERAPALSGPLYGLWPWLTSLGEATVSVGIAMAAIEELADLALRKKPSYSRIPLHERAMAQHQAGRARALTDASRAFLNAAASEAYADAERAGRYSEETRVRCQLAASFGTESCAEAVDLVCAAAGSSAIRLEHGFERHHRDVHALTKHTYRSPARYEDIGKILFGLPPDFWVLDL